MERQGFHTKREGIRPSLGPQDRKLKELEDTHELIDVLHKTLLLWESSKRDELLQCFPILVLERTTPFTG
jgi:hypothetical protein